MVFMWSGAMNRQNRYRKAGSYRDGFVYSMPNTIISSSKARSSVSIKLCGEEGSLGLAAWWTTCVSLFCFAPSPDMFSAFMASVSTALVVCWMLLPLTGEATCRAACIASGLNNRHEERQSNMTRNRFMSWCRANLQRNFVAQASIY